MEHSFKLKLLSGILIFLLNSAQAQQKIQSVLLDVVPVTRYPTVYQPHSPGVEPTLRINNIKMVALRDFNRKYKEVDQEMWIKTDKGYEVRFTQGTVTGRATYSHRGNWESSILKYKEEKLPQDIRETLDTKYSGFDILFVQELFERHMKQPEYYVHMQYRGTYKIVQFVDMEYKTVQSFTIQKK